MRTSMKIIPMLVTTLFACAAFAGQPETKSMFYVDLDANKIKSHAQLQHLKNMDVVGVNLKQHWAEVSLTTAELAELKSLNLPMRKSEHRARMFNVADEYLNPAQVVKALTTININYPQITRLFEAGRTTRNRPLMALEVSATPGDVNKPVVLFNAMHHAREVMTAEIVMHIAKVLTEKYGHDTEVTYWLDHYRVVLVPQVNPDGNDIVSKGTIMWRKNAYKLNGKTVGVDLNRNYPMYWNYCNGSAADPYSEVYRGPAAGSEPETQAMMNLVTALKPVANISYHSYSQMILFPFGCQSVNNPAKDLFKSIGQTMNAQIRDDDNNMNAYEIGTAPELLYEADGSDLDWQWKEHGVFAYCIEVNRSDFHPDYATWRNVTVERQEGGWQALLRRMSQSGFRAHIQTATPDDLSYLLKKIDKQQKIAFDADAPNRNFKLRSASGLLYQLTEKGQYELTILVKNQAVKTLVVNVGDELVDLGEISIS